MSKANRGRRARNAAAKVEAAIEDRLSRLGVNVPVIGQGPNQEKIVQCGRCGDEVKLMDARPIFDVTPDPDNEGDYTIAMHPAACPKCREGFQTALPALAAALAQAHAAVRGEEPAAAPETAPTTEPNAAHALLARPSSGLWLPEGVVSAPAGAGSGEVEQ